MPEEAELIHIVVTVQRITQKAYRVTTHDYRGREVAVWLPRAAVRETDCIAEGDEGYMLIPPSSATALNLIKD